MADDEREVKGVIEIKGDVGAGAAVGPGATVTADIIAGGDVNIEHYHAYKPKPEYQPPPLPEPNELPAIGALPPGSYLTHSRNPYFTGREKELKDLARSLLHQADGRNVIVSQTTVVSSLGGIGKTQLAVEFAHRYGQFFAGGVYWLNCATAEGIPTEVAIIGGESGMGLYQGADGLTLEDKVGRVKQAWQEPVSRLLIFDNCEEEAILKTWRPVTGGCRVLVTSRRGRWAGTLGVMQLSLEVLSRPESVTLLRRFVPQMTDKDTEAIADELGDLPLALHLAGSFLRRYRSVVTPGVYLTQLKDKALLDHPSLQGQGAELSPTDHELHVARTFALSYDRLNAEDPIDKVALDLLARAACFASGEMLPVSLLVATLGNDVDDVDGALLIQDGVTRLVSLGLLTQDIAERCLLHRLLAVYVQEVLAGEFELKLFELGSYLPALVHTYNEQGLPGYAQLDLIRLHLIAYLAICVRYKYWDTVSNLAAVIDNYLLLRGYSTDRLIVLKMGLEAAQATKNRQAEGSFLSVLGNTYENLGQIRNSLSCYEKSLAIAQELNNLDGQSISLSNIGGSHYSLGDVNTAIEYYNKALAISSKVGNIQAIGRDLGHLGNSYHILGKFNEADRYYNQALDISRNLNDLRAENNWLNAIGDNHRAMKQPQESITYYEHAISIAQQLGNRRGEANSLNGLGFACQDLKQFDRALNYHEQALSLAREMKDRSIEATQLGGMGIVYAELGDTERAIEHIEQAMLITREIGDLRNKSRHAWNLGKLHLKDDPNRAVELMSSVVEYEQKIGHADAVAHARQLALFKVIRGLHRLRKKLEEFAERLSLPHGDGRPGSARGGGNPQSGK